MLAERRRASRSGQPDQNDDQLRHRPGLKAGKIGQTIW
ncbi:hypothetical protein M8494_37115 [Serratia ureilytica]